VAYVEQSCATQTADLLAHASSILMLPGCFALMLAAGDDKRGKPADPRRAAEQVEIALEAGGAHHFVGIDSAWT